MIECPLTKIREDRNYTRYELGMILGLSEATIKRIEIGATRVPAKCSSGLEKLGLDPADVIKQQEMFIAEKVKQLLERGKTKKG